MKRIISIFLASTCLFSCIAPSNTVFAGSKSSLNEGISYKKPKSPESKKTHISYCENQIRQKAFLTALLCATGTDVYIKPLRKSTKKKLNLKVSRIGDTDIKITNKSDNFSQLKALALALKDKINLKIHFNKKHCIQTPIKINGYTFKMNDVLEYGDKILELFCEKNQNTMISSIQKTDKNLTQDTVFMYKIKLLFKDILPFQESPTSSEETQSTKIPSNPQQKKKRYINKKAFLTALLCLNDSNVYIKPFPRGAGRPSWDFKVQKIDDQNINYDKWDTYNEIKALINTLENKKDNLYFNGLKLSCYNTNEETLTDDEMDTLGKQITELINERKRVEHKEKIPKETINLKEDAEFLEKARNILGSILNSKIQKNVFTFNINFNHILKNYDDDISTKYYNVEKSLLTAILCATGTDVDIIPVRDFKNQLKSFQIINIDNTPIDYAQYTKQAQKNSLVKFLSENQTKIKFKYNPPISRNVTGTMVINGKLLKYYGIMDFGKKAFDLISQKCQETLYSPQRYINLTADPSFRENAIKLLRDIIPDLKDNEILTEDYEYDDKTMSEDSEEDKTVTE